MGFLCPQKSEYLTMNPTIKSHDVYEVFRPLMKRFGARCSPPEFYWAVNHALHNAQARIYDERYRDMVREEQMVWQRLFSHVPAQAVNLGCLDIGCGTGLVAHFAGRFCPAEIRQYDLLDPSAEMLRVARRRADRWPFAVRTIEGDLFALDGEKAYHLITINSVLHHIVELPPFLEKVQSLLAPGGLFLTAQDPRDSRRSDDDTIRRRKNRTHFYRGQNAWKIYCRRLITRPVGRLLGLRRDDPVTRTVNQTLIDRGVIRKPMHEKDLFSITDIHVPDQPLNLGGGIDLALIKQHLPRLQLLREYTYHYHDLSWSRLSEDEIAQEKIWWNRNDPHGALIASVWQKPANR